MPGVLVDVEPAIVIVPGCSAAISSSTGPIIVHGPHHSTRASTSTGPVAPLENVGVSAGG